MASLLFLAMTHSTWWCSWKPEMRPQQTQHTKECATCRCACTFCCSCRFLYAFHHLRLHDRGVQHLPRHFGMLNNTHAWQQFQAQTREGGAVLHTVILRVVPSSSSDGRQDMLYQVWREFSGPTKEGGWEVLGPWGPWELSCRLLAWELVGIARGCFC